LTDPIDASIIRLSPFQADGSEGTANPALGDDEALVMLNA
jgi:hypothetical protein